ncbi:hypothetical protein LBMAG30_15170 [Comamonadaceae bacterium]|nr:hypothetical protein LBMAG30_15170 [Comamonadaceae bacterium]
MNPLQTELQRLYSAPEGVVRALVLELARPADWGLLSPVWRGLQTDLALPAPAVMVSGVDGYQLWLSLAEPVPLAEAAGFLEALRRHYLAEVAPQRIRLTPSLAAPASQPALPVPSQQLATGYWSAFVAPDLAPIFADEPWLDQPPSPEAQASVLAGLQSIKAAAFSAALARLRPVAPTKRPSEPPSDVTSCAPVATRERLSPKAFLLAVVQDPAVALDLRIEAAKALLPHVEG